MINLTVSSDELLLLLGVKEAQIYQHATQLDKLMKHLAEAEYSLKTLEQKNSDLLKDRDMDALTIRDLESKLARVKMMAGV